MKKIIVFMVVALGFMPIVNANKLTVELAESITKRIWRAIGEPSKNCPEIVFGVNNRLASWEKNLITIDSNTVIKPLEGLSKNDSEAALAIIIGHELRHAKKGESLGYATSDDDKSIDIELDADLYGLMMAYFAGYSNAVEVFDTIFSTLKIPNYPNYPPIEERKERDHALVKRAQDLIHLFECGNLLLVSACDTTEYQYARFCYREVQSELLPTPEINYNIGLSFFLEYLNVQDQKNFLFPLGCSVFTALHQLSVIPKSNRGKSRLDSAAYFFQRALNQLDQQSNSNEFGASILYSQVYPRIGLCSVKLLQEDIKQSFSMIQDLEKRFPSHPDVQMLHAIALGMRKNGQDSLQCEKILTNLFSSGSPSIKMRAKHNLEVLRGSNSAITNEFTLDSEKNVKNISNIVDAMRNRANTSIDRQTNNLRFYISADSTIYLIEEWSGSSTNPTQRAFQKLNQKDILNKSINWSCIYGNYFYAEDEGGKQRFILYKDHLKNSSVLYRVFR
jgi:hypothetical protein